MVGGRVEAVVAVGVVVTCSTRLIHWKLSSSVESGRCSATTTILSSLSTFTENTAILRDRNRRHHTLNMSAINYNLSTLTLGVHVLDVSLLQHDQF